MCQEQGASPGVRRNSSEVCLAHLKGAYANASRGCELDRVAHEIDQNPPQVGRVGHYPGQRGRNADGEGQSFGGRERLHLGRHVDHKWTQPHGFRIYLETTGCQPCQVEHLFDKLAQVVGRRLNALHRTSLPRRQFAVGSVAKQVYKPYDCRQRCAQFM